MQVAQLQIPEKYQVEVNSQWEYLRNQAEQKESWNQEKEEVYSKDLSEWKAVCSVIKLNTNNLQRVKQLLIDQNSQWRKLISSYEIVEQIDSNNSVVWEKQNDCNIYSERDFLYLQNVNEFENGFNIFQTSVEHSGKPKEQTLIRGNIY